MRRRRKSNEPRPNFGKGAFTGYKGFRYGEAKPVTLAGSQTPGPKPLLKRAERESLVDRLIDAMDDWRKTPFEHEGAARAGLRVGLILQGHDWLRSDLQALSIVDESLRRVGAERPSWEEAQRAYVLTGDYCHWCYAPFEEHERSRGRRFCSTDCARVAMVGMARKTNHHYGAILRSAKRLIDQEKAPPQTCIYCERRFQADRKQRFCSQSCRGLYLAGDRILKPIQCGQCQTTFKPWNHLQRFCSKACGQLANRRREAESLAGVRKPCAHCQTPFTPKTHAAIYCSKKCGRRALAPEINARKRVAPPPPALCAWCGDEYQPKIALRNGKVGTCGSRCNSEISRARQGVQMRNLTRRTFDHFIVVPIDDRWRRRATPEKLDWQFMEMGLRVTGEAALPAPRVTDGLFS